MHIRSGKIQFLFWSAFFSVMLYLWIIAVGLTNFVFVDEKPLQTPQNITILLFILYGILMILTLAGEVVSTMINSRYYQRFFGVMLIFIFATLLFIRSLFG
jgi:hypothetical protein